MGTAIFGFFYGGMTEEECQELDKFNEKNRKKRAEELKNYNTTLSDTQRALLTERGIEIITFDATELKDLSANVDSVVVENIYSKLLNTDLRDPKIVYAIINPNDCIRFTFGGMSWGKPDFEEQSPEELVGFLEEIFIRDLENRMTNPNWKDTPLPKDPIRIYTADQELTKPITDILMNRYNEKLR